MIRLSVDGYPAPDEPTTQKPTKRSLRDTANLHQDILNRLGPSPLPEDQLIRDLSVGSGDVTPLLVDLEVEGKITRHPGGMLSRRA